MSTSISTITLIISMAAISGLAVSEIANKRIILNFKQLSLNLPPVQTTNKQLNDLSTLQRENKTTGM
ncbi:hypothetical protein [Budvicia aquatica]|uniref:Uncharacterized protein n=1 Tax=Budvicia aquatica TaxID=82979 RepID=A0A2C6DNV1_9GAMM|nr:hypothetical protein [Budvicia aquatica]PHI30373.1 hypothetical protein CRN84_14025 [Budvicia aquatica]VFS49497.1 Uncharacterised protein [Budvicia aquatica]